MDVVRGSIQRIDDPKGNIFADILSGLGIGVFFTKKTETRKDLIQEVMDRFLGGVVSFGNKVGPTFLTGSKSATPRLKDSSPKAGSRFSRLSAFSKRETGLEIWLQVNSDR